MVDFTKNRIFNFKEIEIFEMDDMFEKQISEGEVVLMALKGSRDQIIFTNKRIICMDKQGISGKKKDFTHIFYKSITCFSISTSGTFDRDIEVEVALSGLGNFKMILSNNVKIDNLVKILNENITF